MLHVPKDRLLELLGPHARDALLKASELCMEAGGYEITVTHLVMALLQQPATDVARIAGNTSLSSERLVALCRKALERTRRGAAELPEFSPLLLELLQEALLVANAELSSPTIRTGAIWVALIRNSERYCHFYLQGELESMDAAGLIRGFAELTRGSMEGTLTADEPAAPTASPGETSLQKFGRDITAEARAGRIDPVFCRETEIALMTDILCRRRKNNPILVGEPGIGKTALAEGLALKIIEGDVPDNLKGATLWELDLGALQAGASVKGEFERRLKAVLDEVTHAPGRIVLFIDEAHTLIGGGGPAGGSDAANLLKPSLARGEIRAIAATTWSEYKKYFEKDPALTRRFQLVKLDEPTPGQAVMILRGLRPAYEATHGVYIPDSALTAAAQLSARYITGRCLPDKALDVLDTACVRVAAGQSAKPAALDRLEKRKAMLERELSDLARDRLLRAEGGSAETSRIEIAVAGLAEQAEALSNRWHAEREMVARVIALRGEIANADSSAVGALQDEVTALMAALHAHRDAAQALVNFEVGAEVIAGVIADWTGVPAAAMSDDDTDRLLHLGDRLKAVVRGQDLALDAIHDRLKAARLDFVRENTPRGIFLLVGPSGVGKTETAEQVALNLFAGRQFLTVINMSEYQEKHTVSRLIGSPPGYVGYGEGGLLTEAIRRKPYSVVLLDEVEKAHPDVMNLFFQAFDKGVVNDGEGREIDCRNIVFFMTSNLGSDAIMENRAMVESASMEALEKALRGHLESHFRPALLARMRILCFKPLTDSVLRDIIALKLVAVAERLKATRNLEFSWDGLTLGQIEALCNHADNGARMVEQVIDRWILPPIAEEALTRIAGRNSFRSVSVSARDGGFVLSFAPLCATPIPETEVA
jgi:type VI secretion system protein VasG